MEKRTIVKIVAGIVIVPAVLYGLFMYYVFAALMGVLGLPHIYRTVVPLPENASIEIEAVGETAYRSYGYELEASYQPSDERSGAETIGRWHGDAYRPATYVSGKLILFVPEPSQMFVRTAGGKWKSFWMDSITDSNTVMMGEADQLKMLNDLGIDRRNESVRFEIRYFSAEQNLLIVDVKNFGGTLRGRLFFRFADDGEKLQLLRARRVEIHPQTPVDPASPIVTH
jgi:hypothetical protein